MRDPKYFSIGELAHKVGVTVRTVQYYDQQGLVSPSAKGPQNQRLYTDENVSDLYRILTLKYLGLSLAEIKETMEGYRSNESLNQLASDQMDEIETRFQQLFKRLTTLRMLLDKTSKSGEAEVDWEDAAQAIEACQEDSQFFWRLTCIREDELEDACPGAESVREEVVSKWHELIADSIRLISEKEPVDSMRNHDLARRYLDLDDSQQTRSVYQNFILMENIAPHKHEGGSFDTLRNTVLDHLEKVVEAYHAKQVDGEHK